jgi:hypothetical protein
MSKSAAEELSVGAMPFGGNGEAVFFAKYLLVPDTDADKDSKK